MLVDRKLKENQRKKQVENQGEKDDEVEVQKIFKKCWKNASKQ